MEQKELSLIQQLKSTQVRASAPAFSAHSKTTKGLAI